MKRLSIILYYMLFILSAAHYAVAQTDPIVIEAVAFFGPQNVRPTITIIEATGSSDEITVHFDLHDDDGDLCELQFEYRLAGATDWQTATVIGAPLSFYPGTDLSLTWDSLNDIPFANGDVYDIRISAYDGIAWGDWYELSDVFVINTYIIISLGMANSTQPQINNMGFVAWADSLYDNQSLVASDIYLFQTVGSLRLTDVTYYAATPHLNEAGDVAFVASDGLDGLPQTGTDTEVYWRIDSVNYRITDNNFDDITPVSNIHKIVWAGWDGNDYEIYQREGGITTAITDNAYDDIAPQLNANNIIAWTGWDGNDYEVFMYDNVHITQITDNAYNDNDARINDAGTIVWNGWDGADHEIFFYHNSLITQLTTNDVEDRYPQIAANGVITWVQGTGNQQEIMYFNTSTTTMLTTDIQPDISPALNAGGDVAWVGGAQDSSDIFLYTPEGTVRLTYDGYQNTKPQINDYRSIVWNRWNGTYYEIMLAYPRTETIIHATALNRFGPDWMHIIWTVDPPNAPTNLYWSEDLINWDLVDGPALNYIQTLPDGTRSFIDTGADPQMDGEPAEKAQRFYKLQTIK